VGFTNRVLLLICILGFPYLEHSSREAPIFPTQLRVHVSIDLNMMTWRVEKFDILSRLDSGGSKINPKLSHNICKKNRFFQYAMRNTVIIIYSDVLY